MRFCSSVALCHCRRTNLIAVCIWFVLSTDGITVHLYEMLRLDHGGTGRQVHRRLVELRENHDWRSAAPRPTCLYLQLISRLYPTSDYTHPVVTPAFLFLAEILQVLPVFLFCFNLFLEASHGVSLNPFFFPNQSAHFDKFDIGGDIGSFSLILGIRLRVPRQALHAGASQFSQRSPFPRSRRRRRRRFRQSRSSLSPRRQTQSPSPHLTGRRRRRG